MKLAERQIAVEWHTLEIEEVLERLGARCGCHRFPLHHRARRGADGRPPYVPSDVPLWEGTLSDELRDRYDVVTRADDVPSMTKTI